MTSLHPLKLFEAHDCRRVYAACHPRWPVKSDAWYQAHPTIVLEVDRQVVGYTACVVAYAPACAHIPGDREVLYGHGLYVDPGYRGKGYGRLLQQARLDLGSGNDVSFFLGMTQPGNAPMIRIFEAYGFTPAQEVEGAYPGGGSGVFYTGGF